MKGNMNSLENCFIFSEFTEEELSRLLTFFDKKQFSDKSIIFREGTTGKEFFVIESGGISITKQVKDGTDTVIAKLTSGIFLVN